MLYKLNIFLYANSAWLCLNIQKLQLLKNDELFMIEFAYQVNPEIYLLGESSMKKEMSIINVPEESASEFACKFSACQQETMSNVGESDPFMAVHKWAERNNLISDSNEKDFEMCGVINRNAKSGVPSNHFFDFKNKFYVGKGGPISIETCVVMLFPTGSNKPCFIYLDKFDASKSLLLANSEQAYSNFKQYVLTK